MSWLALIVWLIKLSSQITTYLHDNKMLSAGGAAAIAAALKGQQDDLARISAEISAAGKRFDDAARAGKLPSDIGLRD